MCPSENWLVAATTAQFIQISFNSDSFLSMIFKADCKADCNGAL